MFGRILYISDNMAYIENKSDNDTKGDLLNLHLVFEYGSQNILGEIQEIRDDRIEVKFLGEFVNGKYYNGILRKANLSSSIRTINQTELLELVGQESKSNFVLGKSAIYRNYDVCPNINDLLSGHMCFFGNSGSGKSCGVSRIVQNILSNKYSFVYNANLIFFDSFGEYKKAFKDINKINPNYNYKFITSRIRDKNDFKLEIPLNLLKVDDYAILLQADKHSQLIIMDRAIKYAKIFSMNTPEAIKYKNNIIAKAILSILYSQNTASQKRDDIFTIIDTCHTNEFNFDSVIPGLGYTRNFSECFLIDSKGRFGEEVLITEYILKFIDEGINEVNPPETAIFSLSDLAKSLEFTLISEGFNNNKNMHDDAHLLKVRLNSILHGEIGRYFSSNEYVSSRDFLNGLFNYNNKKAQIININLEGLDDIYAKSIVKIFSRLLFDFAESNAIREVIPFHLFLEEAHRYIQNDGDVFLLGYNIFDRIAKEGRKYGIILDIISQRPVEISDTVVSQCSNFLIFKMTHPKDIKYIEEMLPNISEDVIEKQKTLQPGSCVAFGSAFKIPMISKLEMPNPRPYSSSCDVISFWNSHGINEEEKLVSNNIINSNPNPSVITKTNIDLLKNDIQVSNENKDFDIEVFD